MSPKPIALILGAGPNLGASISSSLTTLGYAIATASRSGTNTLLPSGILSLSADFSSPSSLAPLFTLVKKELGSYPSVVVYNASSMTIPPDEKSLFSLGIGEFEKDLAVNTTSAYAAAQEAVKHWEGMGGEGKRVFIYTGNILNGRILPYPAMLTLGVGKSASAHWVGLADALYGEKGYRFFYADQRQPDGGPMNNEVNGPAHGEFYAELVKGGEGVPWLASFVQGRGYVQF